MTDRVAGLTGLLPQRQGSDRFQVRWLEQYTGEAAPATYPIDATKGQVIQWQMLGNGPDSTLTVHNGQPVGDCFFAGWQHEKIIAITLGRLSEAVPTADDTVTLYLAYDQGQDNGVILADALLWLYQQGHILAFAPVQISRMDEVMSQTGRGLLLGVGLTDKDMGNFERTPPVVWSCGPSNPSNPSNGHCVLLVKKDAPQGNATIVTWGDVQEVDQLWEAACVQEAWLALNAEDRQSMGEVAWAELVADLDALPSAHGISVPTPGPVVPEPIPGLDPDDALPQPHHPLPTNLLEWWAQVEAWVKRQLG